MSSFFARLTGKGKPLTAEGEGSESKNTQPQSSHSAQSLVKPVSAPVLPPRPLGFPVPTQKHAHTSTPQINPTSSNSAPAYSSSPSSSQSFSPSSPSAYPSPSPANHVSASSPAASHRSQPDIRIEDICRLSQSNSLNDQLTAAKLFNEFASMADDRSLEELVHKGSSTLFSLSASSNPTVQTHIIQTFVFLAKLESTHSILFDRGILQLLISLLDPERDLRVSEATLAALTHIARREKTCNLICELGLNKIFTLLKMDNIGLQCNSLALIGALAGFPLLLEQILEFDVLPVIYQLRDKSHALADQTSGRSDVLQNARYCLQMLGFSDRDPTATHQKMVDNLIFMGFYRGHCEAVIRRLRLINNKEPDWQTVMGRLLDEPPPVNAILKEVKEDNRDKEPSVSRSHQSSLGSRLIEKEPPVADEKQSHSHASAVIGLSKEEKFREKSRVEIDRAVDIQNLCSMGFPRKHAILALVYNVNIDRAIEWLFDLQSKKEAHRKSKKSISQSGIPATPPNGGLDSDLDSDSDETIEQDNHSYSDRSFNSPEQPLDIPTVTRNQSAPHASIIHHHAIHPQLNSTHSVNTSSHSQSHVSNFLDSSRSSIDANEMTNWLNLHGFTEFSPLFLTQSMTLDTLVDLSEHDLERIGITALGPRKRILRAIRAEFGNSSLLPPNSSVPPISPTDNSDSELSMDSPQPIAPLRSVSDQNLRRIRTSVSPGVSSHPRSLSSFSSSKGSMHFAFLQAMPLKHSELPGVSRRLDLNRETQALQDALTESGRAFRCCWEIATKDNLLKMMNYSRALHISGHGDPKNLVFENGTGDLSPLDVDTLAKILNVAGTELKFVFVSSCFSSRTALAFAAAGVPHVIAVQEDTGITDTSALAFTSHVYLALMQGLSVADAFNKGRAAVIAANTFNPPCCCAHLHQPSACVACNQCRTPVCCQTHIRPCHAARIRSCCHPDIPHDESLKFLLLPRESDHNERLFEEVEDGAWINKTQPKPLNNLPSLPDHFIGRSRDALVIVPQLIKYRLYTISGMRGVGKSALARSVATFINDRRHFFATYLIRLGDCRTSNDLFQVVARALKLECKESASASADSLVLEHLESYKRDNRHILFVFDDCDLLIETKQSRNDFRKLLRSLLDETPITILITTQKNIGNVDGHTQRVYPLKELHPLDSAALFVNRLPRELTSSDFKLLDQVKSLQDLLIHPLLIKINGNPRLIEFSAELLNFMTMEDLSNILHKLPINYNNENTNTNINTNITATNELSPSTTTHSITDLPEWKTLPDQAKGLLKACQLILNDREKDNSINSSSSTSASQAISASASPTTSPITTPLIPSSRLPISSSGSNHSSHSPNSSFSSPTSTRPPAIVSSFNRSGHSHRSDRKEFKELLSESVSFHQPTPQ